MCGVHVCMYVWWVCGVCMCMCDVCVLFAMCMYVCICVVCVVCLSISGYININEDAYRDWQLLNLVELVLQ